LTQTEIEKYKRKLVEISYYNKKGYMNIQVGQIINTTIYKAVLLLNHDIEDDEVYIKYKDIVKITEFKTR
jgi:hypothetical protein